jgi:hypothetical protein
MFGLLERPVVIELMETASADGQQPTKRFAQAIDTARGRLRGLLAAARRYTWSAAGRMAGLESLGPWEENLEGALEGFGERLQAALRLARIEGYFSKAWPAEACAVLPSRSNVPEQQAPVWAMLVAWAAVEAIGHIHGTAPQRAAARMFEVLKLKDPIASALAAYGVEEEWRWRSAALVRAAFAHAAGAPGAETAGAPVPLSWLHDAEVAWLIGVHEYEGVRYLVREPFERLTWWMALPALLDLAAEQSPDRNEIEALEQALRARVSAAEQAGYRVEALLDTTPQPERSPSTSR